MGILDLLVLALHSSLFHTLNFTEVAMHSGVSQPTLTHAIQRLEQELGGTSVDRDGKDSH
jgi:LysR family hydrogen peroxide-inducible transcriptional activator